MGWKDRIAALLGISAYARPALASDLVVDESVRALYGGQISPPATTRTRWYLADLEAAEYAADQGDLTLAAQVMRAAHRDGVLAGVLSTRTDGLVRLPKRFRGPPEQLDALQAGGPQARSVFEEMFPATELARLTADGIELGVGVGELVPVQGRDYPVLVRLDPQFLLYRWSGNRWFYRSIVGLLPITPGDGRWVLHTPGGRQAPWQAGLWRALARAYVRKEHALLHKDNWEAKLANPARVAVAPQGAAEAQAEGWFRKVMAWGVNTVFGMKPGYDVKLLESNGRGADSFVRTIEDQNNEFVICLAGQTVTTDGGTGFANAAVHKSIRADLIKSTADGLAYTVNTQCLPPWVASAYGEDALDECATVEWDVTPPQDRGAEAQALVAVGTAISQLGDALAAHGKALDVEAVCTRFGIPTVAPTAKSARPPLRLEEAA